MHKSKTRRIVAAVNAGSMADIAFLLLIFFLVTTTIEVDKGILAKLPAWTMDSNPMDFANKNIFSIKINALNQLFVEQKPMSIENLKDSAKEFIANPDKRDDLPDSPKHAIISLQNDRSTDYQTYLMVYNELRAAYKELREVAAQKQFGVAYEKLKMSDQRTINNIFPLIISEAEPTEYDN